MSNLARIDNTAITAIDESKLMSVLKSSLYPGATDESIKMVLAYCQAAKLDPMQKPVHIVPMFDSKVGAMRDVVMPGVGLYRIQAARTNDYAGVSEPEYGPDVSEKIGGVDIVYPAWCKVTVKRRLSDGIVAEFTAIERWKENYAVKGGKEKSIAPNAMWQKRPYGQIAKCAEAQALRKAFPEVGAQPTADEMEGKEIDMGVIERVQEPARPARPALQPYPQDRFEQNLQTWLGLIKSGKNTSDQIIAMLSSKAILSTAQINKIKGINIETGEIDGEWIKQYSEGEK